MRYLLSLAIFAGGCFSYSELPNNRPDPVLRKLADAKILDMQINLHEQPGLCPGAEGKLYVNGTVQWPNLKPVLRSIGNDVDSFAPGDFAISGPLLQGDANAHLHPDPDILKSIEDGFVIDVTYKPLPRFSFHQMFPPEYSCFTGSYAVGGDGGGGAGGQYGEAGNQGQSGGAGGQGEQGGDGAPGGHITAYVTVVATKFYPRLYAVMANGEVFYLAPPDRQLMFAAPGGAGGGGGGGGQGGNGGAQPTKTYDKTNDDGSTSSVTRGTGAPGNGGNGGNGGPGGIGGGGGSVEVVYDAAFPELRQYIAVNVAGGAPGAGGGPGGGGDGGTTNATENQQTGGPGATGAQGRDGREGREGHASVHAGNVAQMFRGIRGIQLLTDGGRHK